MTMTDKRRKQLWIAGGVVAALYFAPSLLMPVRMFIASRPGFASAQPQKPSPIHPVGPQAFSTLQSAGGASADPAMALLAGKYMGDALVKTRQCRAVLELKTDTAASGQYNGYVSMECFAPTMATKGEGPFALQNPIGSMALQSSPASAILSGTVVNGAIELKSTKTIETLADGCPVTALSIRPFATNSIAMDWQEASCPGGQLILQRQ